jgi:hypothetical protein
MTQDAYIAKEASVSLVYLLYKKNMFERL